jgi:hypothetical protein
VGFWESFKMNKHHKNIDLRKYDQATKFLTRPFDNKLSLDQATAIQTLLDRVEYGNKDREFQSSELCKLRQKIARLEFKNSELAKNQQTGLDPDDDSYYKIANKILSEK